MNYFQVLCLEFDKDNDPESRPSLQILTFLIVKSERIKHPT